MFALSNAGISLGGDPFGGSSRVFLGVAAGLVVGKCIGITGFTWLANRPRIARLPTGVRWPQMLAVATLAGVGFTVSLFITTIAFTEDELADPAKVGILVASVVAAAGGSALFALASGRAGRS